ncbi:hypothetical protein Cpir12675_001031 [Ceratocystis pirilliformis]|uniref:AB hydrolase-1 domain-containing protein n=1 Tax=Ceratocystis pirilliformis TaxID=259994 RepID=A0ABR3ZJH6_9PEZI
MDRTYPFTSVQDYSIQSDVDGVLITARLYQPTTTIFGPPGETPTAVFLHSWLMTSEMWLDIVIKLTAQGSQCLTIDRRGYGPSQWTNPSRPIAINIGVFTQDLVSVMRRLNLAWYVIVGSGIGCNESLTALTRYPESFSNCRGLVWIAPLLPFPEQSPESPGTPPRIVWDTMCQGLTRWNPSRAQYMWNIFCEIAQQEGQINNTNDIVEWQRHLMRAVPDAVTDTLPAFLDEVGYNDQLVLLDRDPAFKHMRVVLIHGANDRGNPESATTARIARRVSRSMRVVLPNTGPAIHKTNAVAIVRLIWKAQFGL